MRNNGAAEAGDAGGGGGNVPGAAEGKDDAPAAAGASRPVKTLLPRPAYEGDPQALINVCTWSGSGDVEEARDLIARGINVEEREEHQYTALILAAMCNYIDIVHELIRAGAALDVQDNTQRTALHHAVLNGRIDIVRELIRAGAALDVKNNEGMTALQVRKGFDIKQQPAAHCS